MKKLSKITLRKEDVLSDTEMKRILGGNNSSIGTCAAFIPTPYSTGNYDGYVPDGVVVDGGSGLGFTVIKGISKDSALEAIKGYSGGYWCCDSCKDTWWYNL